MTKARTTWTVNAVQSAKESVREALIKATGDGVPATSFLAECLEKNQVEVQGESNKRSARRASLLLERLIMLISVLVHQERSGQGWDPFSRQCAKEAEDLLEEEGIAESRSKLTFLQGELFLAMSQLSRRSGNHWQSTWQQQLSYVL